MVPDVVGREKDAAEEILKSAGVEFESETTRPAVKQARQNQFPLDERCLYVIRQRFLPDGICRITLAAKQRKEVL